MTATTVQTPVQAEPSAAGGRFPCFDGLRAIAALAVFTSHMFGELHHEGTFTAPNWILNALSRLGLFGVAVFFVISGFLLYRPFAIAALDGRPGPAWLPFWKRRFFRIFPRTGSRCSWRCSSSGATASIHCSTEPSRSRCCTRPRDVRDRRPCRRLDAQHRDRLLSRTAVHREAAAICKPPRQRRAAV